jgi:hypothetical protein
VIANSYADLSVGLFQQTWLELIYRAIYVWTIFPLYDVEAIDRPKTKSAPESILRCLNIWGLAIKMNC